MNVQCTCTLILILDSGISNLCSNSIAILDSHDSNMARANANQMGVLHGWMLVLGFGFWIWVMVMADLAPWAMCQSQGRVYIKQRTKQRR
jgi:hypothetical protein